jgi:3-dehydroquinate dehydratase/shikimate dehydrogenase
MTHLCVSIFVRDAAQAKRDIAIAAEAGADMVELRIDAIADSSHIQQIIEQAVIPCIVTCRPTWEGGQSTLATAERLEMLHSAAANDAACVDLELKTYNEVETQSTNEIQTFFELPRDSRCGVIVSSHDFAGRPSRLLNIVSELNNSKADIAKIVWTARSIRDNIEAFEVLQTRQKPTIALCMGEAGLISRVLANKFGAFLTFASLDKSNGTAAGQVPIADMKNLFRWDAIGPQTKVYGVVAQPVAHSMSPALHNAGFEHVGHDGVYLPLLVEGSYESFKAFMETFLAFEPLHLSGLSVTLPHKENALRYLQEKDAEVEVLAGRIGALNTIIIDRDAGGKPALRGINTDYAAILDSITDKMGITREKLADYRVGVIGAGGTGRTAVAALAHYGATVVVYNRTKEKADALATEFNGKSGQVVSARLEKLCDSCCHIFINTTNVGMHPNVNESPLGDQPPQFTGETVAFDTIYNPLKTKFLQQAEAAGARTIAGIEMFIRQAAAQFTAWTHQPAPTEIFRQILTRRLG